MGRMIGQDHDLSVLVAQAGDARADTIPSAAMFASIRGWMAFSVGYLVVATTALAAPGDRIVLGPSTGELAG